ncbi:DUF4349 domain-containing protein [Streptomyces pseudovenezuelae]|uniref:DUF4349 domain-containing protein n=1 Tax=Streptomyces pseudovenezuelae TaxID=67350 RepID=A0ABT6LS08_9ACTN|nr:DUF4349 domain-containing protein [Streptomyces pseudovenezuelae]MDH6218695.1 hypothetical protein [Streptomyces pseudovenezuelae]
MRTRHSVRPVHALTGLLLAASLALAGCGGSDSSDSGTTSAADAKSGPQAAEAAPGGEQDSAGDKNASGGKAPTAPKLSASHIIRTASLTVQVKDVPKALDEARTTTENAGGYVGDETTSRDEEGDEHTRVVLRVPVEKYDEVLVDLQGAGKLLHRTAKAQDVTDQVVDVESRIKSQRVSVARVRELMDQATKLSDVLELEGELSTRESDLEALLAQQASLKDRTSLATITLSLTETPVKAVAKDDDTGFVDALAGGWDAFVTMLRWLAVAFGAVLPFLAVAALLVLAWLRLIRPRLPRRPATAPATSALGPLPSARPVPDTTGRREGGEQD